MIQYPTDREAKSALLSCGARLYARGLVAANDGNLSIKVSPETLWTTPSGVSKGFMHEAQLVKVDLHGTVLSGHARPSSELKLHLRLYRELPEIGAVVHAHPPCATAFACAGLALDQPVLQEAILQLGAVPLLPYALPGSDALAEGVAPACHRARALLLEYHGAVTWGKHLDAALHRMEALEQLATVSLHLRSLGSTRTLPPSLVDELLGLRDGLGL